MSDVVDLLWARIEPIVFITREQFAHELENWEIESFSVDGELAFVGLTKGPEFHFESFGTGTQITRGMMRERTDRILDRHGYMTTRTPKDGADRQHRFNKAYGFRVVGEDEFFIFYRLDRKCQ